MSDSESLKIGVTPKVAIAVDNVIAMNNRPATNLNQIVESAVDYGSVKNAELTSNSTTNDDGCATNTLGESQCQTANTVQHFSQTQATHNHTTAMDSTVANPSQNNNSSKRVIRKIMVIDPKKLQQAGLDRKLAEAIGRQKLKALAKEKRKTAQFSDSDAIKLQKNEASDGIKSQFSAKLANNQTQTEISSLTATTAQAVVSASVTTTYTATSNSTPNTTNSTQTIFPAIKPTESLNKCILLPTAAEIPLSPIINTSTINGGNTAQSASQTPTVERKVFVTPKITITRPGEESPTVRIVPEHRLENVKYILQCKILKRQQLAAVQAPQTPQVASVTKSPQTPPTTEMSWIEPKVEMEEFINIPKVQQPKKPSPAKTPQDIARVLDFSADTTAATATTPQAKEHKVENVNPNSTLHIKNYSLNATKVSPVKDELSGTRAVDVARLVARVSNVTMRKNVAKSPDKAINSTEPMEIPKATIRCKKLPVQYKQNSASNSVNINATKQSPVPKEASKGATLLTHKNVGLTAERQTTNPLYKDPVKQTTETLNDATAIGATMDNQNTENTQFNNFPLFSPLKQPFPVVTHSQDLPLPTISTFKTPFPTTLIKVGQMAQAQHDAVDKSSDDFLKNTYFVTPAVPMPVAATPKSLIVLENKVLSQDEKIDLTALGFGTPKLESTPEITMDTSNAKATTPKTPETAQAPQTITLPSSTSLVKSLLPQKGAKINNRTIVSMDKLKLSSDKIAELVKAIQHKNANSSKHFLVVRKIDNPTKTSSSAADLSNVSKNAGSGSQTNVAAVTRTQPAENTARIDYPTLYNNAAPLQKPTETVISPTPNMPVAQLSALNTSTVTQLSTTTATATVSTTFTTDTDTIICPEAKNLEVSQFKNPLPPNPQKFSDSAQNAHNKSAVCVVDSGDESDASLSAVDFIASLAAENPITEDMKLELSPEELNLNASFAMNFSPLRIPNRDRTESVKSEIIEQDIYESCDVPNAEALPELFEPEVASDEMQIGKIITISEENILKAVAASNKLEINNDEASVGAQEVFKLTKSTERLDTIHEESQHDNLDNVNNLDIVTTDSLTESTVGPIIVKNIGAIDNFEGDSSTAVIVKNLDSGATDTIGEISENTDPNKVQLLPVEELSKTVEENIADADKIVSKTTEEPSTINAMETIETASIPDVTNVNHKNTEVALSVEVNAKVSSAVVEEHNTADMPSPLKPNALAESEKEVSETPVTESVTAITKTDAECPAILTPVADNHLNIEKNAVSNENVKPAAPKRLPRFKKGKINLVQRKKTTASAPETKRETQLVSKNMNTASSEQKLDEKEVANEETAVTTKLDEEGNEEVEKIGTVPKVNEKEAAIETKSVYQNIKEASSDIKLTDGEILIETTAATSQLDSETNEEVEKMNEDPKVNENEAVMEIKSESHNINDASSAQKSNEEEAVEENTSPDRDSNEEVENINETVVQTNDLNPVVEESKALAHNLAVKDDVIESEATKRESPVDSNTDLPVSENLSSNNETSLKSGGSKRKTAMISELLHPPKIPKRKSFGTDIKSDISGDVSTEHPSSTDNLLLSAVKAATEETKLTPAKNPFKKTKVEAIGDQQAIKGIHNLLTKFNIDQNVGDNEEAGPDQTSEEQREVVSEEGNLEENNTEQKLQGNCEQKIERLSNLVEHTTSPQPRDEKKSQSNTDNSDASVSATAEIHKTLKNCDILHVITEEKLLQQNSEGKLRKAGSSSTEDVEKPGNMKTDFLGFNHNSPSTHNIENNLQHILTITTSAEKTKTRDVNYSTAERESPHVSLSDSSVKSSSTTGKTSSRKSKLVHGRKSTNRRVPLKKRWGVLHESDDDINITDDTSPADDDEEEDIEPAFQDRIKIPKSETERKKLDTEKVQESSIKEGIVPATVVTEPVLAEGKKRNRCSEDSMEAVEHATDSVTVLKNTTSEDLQAPSKKVRLDAVTENISTTKSAENLDSLFRAPEIELSDKAQEHVSELETTLQDTTANEVTDDAVINIKETTPKPKSKGGRKNKAKTPLTDSSHASAVEESTKTAKSVENKDDSLLKITSASDKDERVTSVDLMKKKEEDNEPSSVRRRRSKTLERKEPVAKEVEPVDLPPKSDKKRGRKSKLNASNATTPKTSAVAESELGESLENSVDCSMSESVKTESNEQKRLTAEKQKHVVQQEFTTSTPTVEQTPEASATKRGRKRKLVVEAVEEDKNETMNVEDSTPVLRKKRGRKPKSSTLNDTGDVVCNGVAEAEKTVDITQESFRQDVNETLPEASLDTTETANASLATTECETPMKIPKKRGRKPKALLATPDTPANSDSPKPNEKQQGRRGKVVDLETRGTFNERLLLITNRAQLDTDEVLTADPKAKKSKASSINCGLCLQQLERDAWVNHLATHYGVGWIVGEMTAINVTIRNEVLKAMTAFLKMNAGKYPLTCRMCQRTYRSALGTLLHIEVCGATDTRVPCDYCKKEYSKLSVVSHMRLCSKRMEDEQHEESALVAKEGAAGNKEAVLNNVGRLKRASVQKAEKMLKAFGSDTQSTGIYSTKDAKNHVEFVAPVGLEKLLEKCTEDLASTGSAECPALGCKYTANELSAVKEHFASCELKETIAKGSYNCKLCAKSSKSYRSAKYVIKHILQQHKSTEVDEEFEADASDCGIKTDDESSSDDDDVSSGVDSDEEQNDNDDDSDSSSNEGEGRKSAKKKKSVKKKSAASAGSNSITADRLHPPRETDYSGTARLLWKEFSTENYSTAPLFNDVKVKYTICARSEYEKYIPDMETSMKFNYKSDLKLAKGAKVSFGKAEELNWSQLQLLEKTSVKHEQFTFLGEAIKTVTWLPLPTDIKDQYLLISTRRAFTRFKCPKVDNTLLWLYKVTAADQSKSFDMQLQYAINIPDGPVHCLSFLPSGGYDAHANRLGVVAVGTAKNTVKVYALPLNVENELLSAETTENSSPNFTTLQLDPAWLLALDLSDNDLSQHPFVDTQCTALCWSEFSGHMHIFAGYANGCVAYWDLSSDRNLNRLLIDGVPHYVPLNFFYTREKNVRAMALHYDSSGVRVIAVIVARRLLILYDLRQFNRPFVLKEEITKNEATDLEWSPIWQSLAISMADSLPNNGRCIYAVNPTNIVFKNETIDKMNAGVNKIHYNPLQHVLANATDNGDVVLLDIREMHLKDIMRDSLRSSQAVAIMDMKCLNGTDIPKFDAKTAPPDWSFHEEDCNEKYGLVFGPLTRIDKSLKPQYLSEQRRVPVHLTPCTRINTIHCNFNNHGKHLVAAGYENGFLRVFHIDRKSFFY